MNYLIALVESLRGANGVGDWKDGYHCALSDVRSILENALSKEQCNYSDVQPLDPKLLVQNGDSLTEIRCSNCGRWMVKISGHINPEYCQNCGKHFSDKTIPKFR